MKVNHFIVGTRDVGMSAEFYQSLFGMKVTSDISFTGEGKTLRLGDLEILLLPFEKENLPNPAHFALEVDSHAQFLAILGKAEAMGLAPRSMPPRDSEPGSGEVRNSGGNFKIFYVFDPGGSNLEVMVRE